MSKMDALRAMREERYEQAQKAAAAGGRAAGGRSTTAPRPPVAPPVTPRAAAGTRPAEKEPSLPEVTATAASEDLCGHRNMGGRSCTRPAGHSEKSHRYG